MAKKKRSDGNVRAIVAAHDKLKVENEKLKLDLQDKAGNYEQRIKFQKDRIYSLEEENDSLKCKIEDLREVIIRLNLKLVDQENSTDQYLTQLKEKERR